MKKKLACFFLILFFICRIDANDECDNGTYNEQNCNGDPTCCGNCNGDPAPCGNCSIAVEWLYMLPTVDEPYYALTVDSSQKRIGSRNRWQSGYRAELAFFFPCCDYLKGRWTGFWADKRNTLSRENLSIQGLPIIGGSFLQDSTRNATHFSFNYLDITYGRQVYCQRCLVLTVEGGVKLTALRFREKINYGTQAEVRNRSNAYGVGPEAAFLVDYALCSKGFSIVSREAVALVVSRKDARIKEFFTEGETNLQLGATKNSRYWVVTPALDARVGLNYHFVLDFSACRSGYFGVELEIGYEFIYLFKGADRIYFVDSIAQGQSFTEQMDFALHGPYVRFGLCF